MQFDNMATLENLQQLSLYIFFSSLLSFWNFDWIHVRPFSSVHCPFIMYPCILLLLISVDGIWIISSNLISISWIFSLAVSNMLFYICYFLFQLLYFALCSMEDQLRHVYGFLYFVVYKASFFFFISLTHETVIWCFRFNALIGDIF